MNVLARNKRAGYDYQLFDSYEAGIVLAGWEVKGIMEGRVQMVDSYAILRNGEAWLINCHITPGQNVAPNAQAEPRRSRKLLLRASELRKLIGKVKQTGLTIVALNLHRSHGKIKLQIALGKGKKLYDKRRAMREKEARRGRAP